MARHAADAEADTGVLDGIVRVEQLCAHAAHPLLLAYMTISSSQAAVMTSVSLLSRSRYSPVANFSPKLFRAL
mgnify:CR=1 FL=1